MHKIKLSLTYQILWGDFIGIPCIAVEKFSKKKYLVCVVPYWDKWEWFASIDSRSDNILLRELTRMNILVENT